MYQLAIEGILGLRRQGDTFAVSPSIPAIWSGFTLDWRIDGTDYHVEVRNPERRGAGVASATLDDMPVDAGAIPIFHDRRKHHVVITLGEVGLEAAAARHDAAAGLTRGSHDGGA
jgi:cellobiose phosphorylase